MSDKPSVVEALAAVMEDVRAVRKGDRNSQQGYQFRGIDAVMNAAGPAFRKHGVVVVPILEDVHYRDVQTSTGKASRECTVKVRYRFHGPAGDYIECVTPGESMDFGDKGAPKAMSVAYRIALLQALCLPTDDVDPDAQSYERGGSERPRQNGHQQDVPPPADSPAAARLELAALADSISIPRPVVAAEYAARMKTPLGEETDVKRIRTFLEQLKADPHTLIGMQGEAA